MKNLNGMVAPLRGKRQFGHTKIPPFIKKDNYIEDLLTQFRFASNFYIISDIYSIC